jgi:hypothetical protein
MFTGKLYEFQEAHESNLLRKCKTEHEMVLSAPTEKWCC